MLSRAGFLLLFVVALGACASQQGTIGAILAQRPDGTLVIHEVPKGLAAAKGGLKPGDEILLVDGADVRMMDEKAVYRSLSGEIGSKVRLTIVRGEEVLHVTLERTPARKYRPTP
jgi:C-terminal processing protease CtpA/Prc